MKLPSTELPWLMVDHCTPAPGKLYANQYICIGHKKNSTVKLHWLIVDHFTPAPGKLYHYYDYAIQ